MVRAVNAYLGGIQTFGSSYHLESQCYLEARRNTVNNVLTAYCRSLPDPWARWFKLAELFALIEEVIAPTSSYVDTFLKVQSMPYSKL